MKIKYLLIILIVLSMTHCTTKQSTNESLKEIYFDYDSIDEQVINNAQDEISSDYNKTDNSGKKQGLWIEKYGLIRIERYYKDGICSGVYKQFNSDGDLLVLGEYTNDKMSGIWYYYNYGQLWITFEDFAENYDTITSEGNKERYVPDYKCYSKAYYSNGNLKDEGWLLWNEGDSPVSDFSVEYGTWKYYNEKGELVKTKEYKP